MNPNLSAAQQILTDEHCTCVLCDGSQVYRSAERGVAPLIGFYQSQLDFSSFSAADKVVGKAAAMLYCLLHVREIYAPIMTADAKKILKSHHISAFYDHLVPTIFNRTRTAPCPMEQAVENLKEPEDGYRAILETLKKLKARQ